MTSKGTQGYNVVTMSRHEVSHAHLYILNNKLMNAFLRRMLFLNECLVSMKIVTWMMYMQIIMYYLFSLFLSNSFFSCNLEFVSYSLYV